MREESNRASLSDLEDIFVLTLPVLVTAPAAGSFVWGVETVFLGKEEGAMIAQSETKASISILRRFYSNIFKNYKS